MKLINQHHLQYRPLADLSAGAVISLRSVDKWLARYRSEDRPQWRIDAVFAELSWGHLIRFASSTPWSCGMELGHQRLYLRQIARLLSAPFSTVAKSLIRLGLGRLRNLDDKPPVQRYERKMPEDLVHISV